MRLPLGIRGRENDGFATMMSGSFLCLRSREKFAMGETRLDYDSMAGFLSQQTRVSRANGCGAALQG